MQLEVGHDLPVGVGYLLDSCSPSDLLVSKLSISSMKTTEGWWTLAMANKALTIFSPSPTHLEVRLDAEMEKNVEPDWQAIHFPIRSSQSQEGRTGEAPWVAPSSL